MLSKSYIKLKVVLNLNIRASTIVNVIQIVRILTLTFYKETEK